MANNKLNIIVGAARFFVGTASATKPAYVDHTSYATTVAAAPGFRDVGFTQEGVELSYEPEYGEVEVDQSLDTPRMHKTSQKVSLKTTLAEATLENLVVAWGQTDATLTSSSTASTASTAAFDTTTLAISAGVLGESPVERKLIAVGPGPEKANAGYYNERVYFAYRALSVESSSHKAARSEATVFPVSFRLLPDDATNEYGSLKDRTRTW